MSCSAMGSSELLSRALHAPTQQYPRQAAAAPGARKQHLGLVASERRLLSSTRGLSLTMVSRQRPILREQHHGLTVRGSGQTQQPSGTGQAEGDSSEKDAAAAALLSPKAGAGTDGEGAPPPPLTSHNWAAVAGWLFLAGFALGAPLDGLHSVVGLQVYDGPGAIVIGPQVDGLYTSLWVPPLLGTMYVVVGFMQLKIDALFPPDPSSPASKRSLTHMLTSMGLLIGLLRLSSLMYENGLPALTILEALLVCAYGSWYSLDRTLPGFLLALFVGTCAPITEVLFIKLGCWHYTTPDINVLGEGLVSWTSCCYFFYSQWVATVARALDSALVTPQAVEAPK